MTKINENVAIQFIKGETEKDQPEIRRDNVRIRYPSSQEMEAFDNKHCFRNP